MGFPNEGFIMTKFLQCFFAILAALGTFSLISCTRSSAVRIMPAPLDSRALAFDSSSNVFAVLAGSNQSKSVYIMDARSGRLRQTFGVSNHADSIAFSRSGQVLVGYASGTVGALDVWSEDGRSERSIPLPGPALGVTALGPSLAAALVSVAGARSIELVDISREARLGVHPLPQGVSTVAHCAISGNQGVVFSAGINRRVEWMSFSGEVRDFSLRGISPFCSRNGKTLYALQPEGHKYQIGFSLTKSGAMQYGGLAAPFGARTASLGPNNELLVLVVAARTADVQVMQSLKEAQSAN